MKLNNLFKLSLILLFFSITLVSTAQWTPVGQNIYGDTLVDHLGRSISLSEDGSIMAISASDSNGEGIDNCGQVRVFRYGTGVWHQIGEDLNGDHINDYFGSSVSLSADGSILAVGAVGNDDNGNGSGQVCIYENIYETWTLIGEINGEAENDLFGISVSLSADGIFLAAGAKENDGNGTSAGHVRVYQHAASWGQIGNDIDGDSSYDHFGYSVSLNNNGNILAVGAYGNGSGQVKIFEKDGSNWVQIGSDIMGDNTSDYFGYSVSINGDGSIFAASAYKNDVNGSDAGQVKIFENNAGVWQQKGNNILGQSENDYFGYNISLSSDGLTVAVGAYKNDEAGNDAGSAKVLGYSSIANEWVQIEDNILGLLDNNSFGRSVCLANNGQIVAVGATGVNGGTGRIRVFASSCGDVGNLNIGNDTIICNNQDISLIGNVSGQYLWDTGETSQNISVSDSGYFYVTVTQDICYVYDSIHITDMTPDFELFSDTLTCSYDTITIDAGIWESYLWNTGSNNQSINVNTEGLYLVTISNSYNCINTDSVYLSHSINPTGIEDTIEICLNGEITISANPINNNTWNLIQNTDTINYLFVNDTTFFLEAIDTMLCVITDTVVLKVDSNFIVSTWVDDTILTCYNNELTIFCNPENENIWNSILNSDSITYLAVNDTVFYLQVSSPIGCQYTDTIFIDQDSTLNFIFDNTYISSDTIILGDTLWLYGTESSNSDFITFTKNPGIFLPDGLGIDFADTINIISNGTINNLNEIQNIRLNMEHSYAGDLNIDIICPNGQTMEILTYPNGLSSHFLGEPIDNDISSTLGEGYNYDFSPQASLTFPDISDQYYYTFTDNDGTEYVDHRYIPAGEYAPTGNFNDLIGCPVNGEWKISIEDHMSSDNGVIFSWSISLYGSSITTWSGENIDESHNDTTFAIPITTGWQDYTYSLENEYGCINDTTISIYVDNNVNVREVINNIKLYPNPASQSIVIHNERLVGKEYELKIYNPIGKLVYTEIIESSKTNIDVSSWENGIYFVAVGAGRIKFVKE